MMDVFPRCQEHSYTCGYVIMSPDCKPVVIYCSVCGAGRSVL